jgi:hypothetical protein
MFVIEMGQRLENAQRPTSNPFSQGYGVTGAERPIQKTHTPQKQLRMATRRDRIGEMPFN